MTEQWFNEELHPWYRKSLKVLEVLEDEQTDFQHLQIVRTEFFGKALILDGIIQLTERDNMGYHEMITHVPMLAVDNPETVLIVGGGDGGTLQQVLKHASVKKVVMSELDRRVVELSRKHFTEFAPAFDDPRFELVIEDAFTYMQRNQAVFDVIISDTTDPIGMAERLFSEEFYELMKHALKPGGAVSTQCEQMYFDTQLIKDILAVAKRLTQNPAYYYSLVPTYPGGGIGFMYMSDTPWSNGLGKTYPQGLNYLNPEMHRAAFALPEFFRREL
ncbi:hypothetical protein ADN00_10365 [Ornatilinea apprima]|uniref:Polyamine aminopropyltransferase n=1 Tax=Ornatilinea apprima TaxID=1134406 RepID=A0A0P6XUC5_9CHLR|nr:polyamine aminopropyltransferase [Ornatilinea apprima]KPL76975.1 hypothetical protein ADN00_10365 [Ornatilinea apprima]